MNKKSRFLYMSLVSCTVFMSFQCAAAKITGTVTAVTDGDTLKLTDAKKVVHKIRLASIDAPEIKQFYGYSSKNSLSQLTLNKKVSAQCTTVDMYKRQICTVFAGKVDVNSLQVERGMAWAYLQYAPRGTPLKGIQDKARESQIGLWSELSPEPPWDFRRNVKDAP
jgi:endonuclease YncB( thermonuclease family)